MTPKTEYKPAPEGEYTGETTSTAHERKRKYDLVTLVKVVGGGKKYLLPSSVTSLNTAYQIAKKLKADNKIVVKVETTPNAVVEKSKISNGQFVLVPVVQTPPPA